MTILLIVALFPPLYMMKMIYQMDKVEKEPISLIRNLLLISAFMAWPVSIIESIAVGVATVILPPASSLYILFTNILCIGLVEEAGKFIVARRVWKNPAFNYRFDGVVYCVAASLGFAALENVLYVMNYGIGVGITRALMSIPGHTIFGIYMGIYFSEAKYQECAGRPLASRRNLRLALIIPTLIHGAYDSLLSFQTPLTVLIFYVFLIFMYIRTYRRILSFQAQDAPFYSVPSYMDYPL